ncbi:MAG: site-specific DNA-methyltransferase, partial [Firmicutes bacterium]|nr:site-specific DNA-methyltransferase [Bacillota bacterium]
MVGRTSAERTGYATQKPEKLMERIIASCTDEGDLCADFFAGSGTLGAVCEKMGRRWMMCDEGELSVSGQIHRLGKLGSSFKVERTTCDSEGSLGYNMSGGLINLISYETAMPDGLGEYEDELRRYMNEDSLCMVKCWSAGRLDEDGVHRADGVFCDSWGINEVDGFSEDISIIGYDVFGRRVSGMPE